MSLKRLVVVATTVALSILPSAANAQSASDSVIRAQAKQFTDAFGKGDAHALAGLWTENAVFLSGDGKLYKGRPAIEKLYAKLFEAIGPQPIDLQIDSITFPASSVAVEVGVARLPKSGTCAQYTAVHEKTGGKWLMSNVTETSCATNEKVDVPNVHNLDWLAGKWTAKGPLGTIPIRADWDANHNFMYLRFLSATKPGDVDNTQVIGVDRSSGRISSWHFDSNGGYGRGYWIQNGKNWMIRGLGVEPGGRIARATYLIHPLTDNKFTWRAIERTLDGKPLAALTEVTVTREQ